MKVYETLKIVQRDHDCRTLFHPYPKAYPDFDHYCFSIEFRRDCAGERLHFLLNRDIEELWVNSLFLMVETFQMKRLSFFICVVFLRICMNTFTGFQNRLCLYRNVSLPLQMN